MRSSEKHIRKLSGVESFMAIEEWPEKQYEVWEIWGTLMSTEENVSRI